MCLGLCTGFAHVGVDSGSCCAVAEPVSESLNELGPDPELLQAELKLNVVSGEEGCRELVGEAQGCILKDAPLDYS